MSIENMRKGIYNVEYFSGTSVSIHIGDVWVDEITSISYQVSQQRTPIYGYADQLYRDLSKGQVIVQGHFTINFKEAGYLWLILNRYADKIRGKEPLYLPFQSSDQMNTLNIEQLYNGEISTFERNKYYQALAELAKDDISDTGYTEEQVNAFFASAQASLTGFSDIKRAQARTAKETGRAEGKFEVFENAVWQKPQSELDNLNRRTDDPRLNPFDIYIAYGDFAGNKDYDNHTIQKISEVTIIGNAKQVEINGLPIQEQYMFIARNIV